MKTPAPYPGIAAHRLYVQQLSSPEHDSPSDVVSRMVAMQAQDRAGAKWAVGLRMPAGLATAASVDRALDDGLLLRTHVMRWTWQLVCPTDVRWLTALVAPGLFARYEARHRELGLDAATFKKCRATLEKALRDGQHLTREEVAILLTRAKLPARGPALSHLLGHAELEGVICSGATRDRQPTYALLELRAPNARAPMPRGEALGELARRYFRSRGPATVADFAWWAGLTMAEARAGLAAAQSELVSEVLRAETTWRSRESPPPRPSPLVQMLPAFDEYLVAYRDRDAVLDPRYVKRVNAGGGLLNPCVVVDGRVVGVWRRVFGPRAVSIELTYFEELSSKARRAVAAASERYGAFVQLEVERQGG